MLFRSTNHSPCNLFVCKVLCKIWRFWLCQDWWKTAF